MISSIQGYLSSVFEKTGGAGSVAQTNAVRSANNETVQANKPAYRPDTDTVQISAEGLAKLHASQEAAAAQRTADAAPEKGGAVSGISAVGGTAPTGVAAPVQAASGAEELAPSANRAPADQAAKAQAAGREDDTAVRKQPETQAQTQGPVPADDKAPGAKAQTSSTTEPSKAGVTPEKTNGIRKPGETDAAAADITTVKAEAEEAKPAAQEKVSNLSQFTETELKDMVNTGEASPADVNAEMEIRNNSQEDTSSETTAKENEMQTEESNIVTDQLTAVRAGSSASSEVEE